jgi:hypothetical protein
MSNPSTLPYETRQAALKRAAAALCPTGAPDDVARKVLDSVMPWYLHPEVQVRPRVLGLWGMTGTGKTHLVRQLLTALDLDDRTVWLDGGRLARSNFGTNALDPVYESHNGRPFVVVIDEFQHARSRQQMTVEDRGVMRSIWELIDGGKITVHDGERHLEVLLDLRDVLRRALERGMQVKGGRIVAGLELYEELCDDTLGRPKDAAEAPWLIPKEHWQWMRSALERPVMSLSAFMDLMQGLDSGNVLPFVEQLVLSCSMPRVLDASQALVIVLGNLDELYALGEELVPELDPDVLVARHEHIGLTGLQEALYKLFRIEQVARLGSEQFAVPPLSRGRLLAVARTHGDALCGRLRESTGVQVRLGDSFLASVVRGHAIAVLGARPLLNALDRLVPGLMVQAEQHARHLGLPLNAVDIDAVDGGLRLSLRGGKRPQRLCLPLPPGPLDAQGPVHAVHAVHEAGHAVVGLALQGVTPLQVCARSNSRSVGGFVIWEKPLGREPLLRSMVLPQLAGLLGGWVAERVVFGEAGQSAGSSSDIAQATGMALDLIRQEGMGALPLLHSAKVGGNPNGVHHRQQACDELAEQWVQQAVEQATRTIMHERALLDALVKALQRTGSLGRAEVQALVQQHGSAGLRRSLHSILRLAS